MDDVEKQRLAFLYHYTQRVMLADGKLYKEEVSALTDLNSALINAGLMQADGTLRESYTDARDAARASLRGLLDEDKRWALLNQLIEVMEADGERHPAEREIIAEAADALGLRSPSRA